MMFCSSSVLAFTAGILVSSGICFAAQVPAASQPTFSPATTRAATQLSHSLLREIARTVELGQQKMRARKPPAPPPRNSIERQALAKQPDVLTPLSRELVGKRGSIAFTIVDVYDNARTWLLAPPAVAEARRSMPYVVLADCEPTTTLHYTDVAQREMRSARERGDEKRVAQLRAGAEAARPRHRLWVLTDDDRVRQWAQGTRRYIHAEVVSASVDQVPGDYLRAVVVLRMHREAPADAAAAPNLEQPPPTE